MAPLFGPKKKDPKELVREWKTNLRREERKIDRQVREIRMEETKIKKSIKDCAKRNDRGSMTILAKELVQSRKAVDRMLTSKAQMHSVAMQLQQQAAAQRVMGGLQKSTEIMGLMNNLMKLPEIAQTMQLMEREMMKAGVIEEMIEDTLEEDDIEDMDELAEEEVDKVLLEVTGETLKDLVSPSAGGLPDSGVEVAGEEEDIAAKLKALKS